MAARVEDTFERIAREAAAAAPERDHKVTPLELFFDLVFVFALTQVTALMAHDPTWNGVLRGMLVLGVLWWAWGAYAWLTNEIDPEEGGTRLVMFAAIAAMLVASLATPRAFGSAAFVFAGAYAVVRGLHIALYAYGTDDEGVRGAVYTLIPNAAAGSALLFLAAALGGEAREPLWAAALIVDVSGPLVRGVSGWRVSPGHFAERHGLIVLIAIGESIAAIGVASQHELDTATVVAAILGIAVASAQWWIYFDVVAIVAERRLRSLTGDAQNRMARDSYSYLHVLMVAGIVLTAFGIKAMLVDLHSELDIVPAAALCGGAALYLIGHVLFRLRNIGSLSRRRVLAAAVLLALTALAVRVPPLVALGGLGAVLWALIAYEAIRFADARQRVRHFVAPEG